MHRPQDTLQLAEERHPVGASVANLRRTANDVVPSFTLNLAWICLRFLHAATASTTALAGSASVVAATTVSQRLGQRIISPLFIVANSFLSSSRRAYTRDVQQFGHPAV